MTLPRALPLAVLAMLLLAPAAAASGSFPPADAARMDVGGRDVAYWIGDEPSGLANFTGAAQVLETGSNVTFWVGVEKTSGNVGNLTLYGNLTSVSLGLDERRVIETTNTTSDIWAFASMAFQVPLTAADPSNLSLTVDLFETTANGTALLGQANATLVVSVSSGEVPVPAPPGGLPTAWIVAGAAVLVVGGAGAAIIGRQRAIRARMNKAPRRSQVMREVELERQLDKARAKDPEQAVQIQQEIREQETVREQRREVQILQARRADAVKTMDLLKKRHDAGGLTKLQYDTMVAKKQADLERIDREIAQMENEDAGSAA